MRTMLFLLLSWALSQPGAIAQTRAAGPWRVTYRLTREKDDYEWGSWESSIKTARKTLKADSATAANDDWGSVLADTTTTVRVRRKLELVPWNINPDSITLFLNCKNPLLAPIASRNKSAAIHFTATGATVQLVQNRLLLVPSTLAVILWAYQGQQLLFRHEFKVVPPPPPTLKCFIGGGQANICKGPYEQQSHIRTVTLRAIPAIDFAEMMPTDARYRVARFRATLLRQGRAVELAPGQLAEKTVQGPQADVSDLTSTSQIGDQLQVDILLVQRLNALGVVTAVPVAKRFIVGGLKCPPE